MSGMMGPFMRGPGLIIKYRAMASIRGRMAESSAATGLRTICMAKESIRGKTVDAMRDSISTIRSMDLEHTHGLMEDNIQEIGPMANKKEKEIIKCLTGDLDKAFGKTASVSDGSMNILMIMMEWVMIKIFIPAEINY